jgi:Holliday junction resolvase
MPKPETLLVRRIMDWLEASGGWWMKVHGSPFQKAGVPDIIGCYKGRFVGIEVKVGNNTPTLIQKSCIQLLKRAGARVGVAYSVEEAIKIRDGKEGNNDE